MRTESTFYHRPTSGKAVYRPIAYMVLAMIIAAAIANGWRSGLQGSFSSPSSGAGFCLVQGSRPFSDTPLVTGAIAGDSAFAGPTDLLADPCRPGFSKSNLLSASAPDHTSFWSVPIAGSLGDATAFGKDATTRAGDRSLGNADAKTAPDLDRLLDAIALVESNNQANAVGDGGTAVGAYQIRPIFLRDINRILGCDKYMLNDRWDPVKSREMAVVYMNHYGRSRTLLDMARQFNGGPLGHLKRSTLTYEAKIKAILN